MHESDISVLYVARGGSGGLQALQAFSESYHRFDAGIPHRLLLLAKNWNQDDHASLGAAAESLHADIRWLPDDGFDWGAYFRVAAAVTSTWLCLLNSHSRVRVDGWLARLHAAAATSDGIGLAGATGSWESPRPGSAYLKRRGGWPRLVAARIWHFRRYAPFAPFPNPHVRSTGLIVRRTLFCEFATMHEKPAAHRLESARAGPSSFVLRKGQRIVVVGADSVSYAPAAWPASRTFRSGDQGNLLISDNRTIDFADGLPQTRRFLTELTWGD